uniref:Protein ARMADILLO REPEAT KINESIN1 n=1 Tax=Physcomitrium patens TaxID=3218 RepID=A0A7I4F6W3_PHYPA
MAFAQAHKSRPLSVNSGKNVAGSLLSPTPSPSQPDSSKGTHMRTKSASPVTSSSTTSTRRQSNGSTRQSHDGGVANRVRVTVRLRPRNAEELEADLDFADCVELQPELKRLKLRKNNWESETYQFDEILTETASQKRVYEVVAKPVVESVLEGYNGTVMAYGQTGTGKTFTLGKLGDEDTADRGIMVRALEDILSSINHVDDTVTVSYLQLYMESVQDLLAPERDNCHIQEDPKTGDVSVPGATQIQLTDHQSFVNLLDVGESNRVAANTKLNTESSRSHALLLVQVKKAVRSKEPTENGNGKMRATTIRRSKLLIVDLAGSERVDKSGSEGHTLEEAKSINLSLTALGKCINALAENSPHVPIRDSKLTRLLRDSFGGTARTSLIVTIGPSPRHRGETTSTIMFGQRAMKVENMVKLKEEFDYKSLCRRMEAELDRLVAENERQVKARQENDEELDRVVEESRQLVMEAENRLQTALESIMAEKSTYEQEVEEMRLKCEKGCEEVEELRHRLEEVVHVRDMLQEEIQLLTRERQNEQQEKCTQEEELKIQKEITKKMETQQKELAEEIEKYKKELAESLESRKIERTHRERLEDELGCQRLQLERLEKELQAATPQIQRDSESNDQSKEIEELRTLLEIERQNSKQSDNQSLEIMKLRASLENEQQKRNQFDGQDKEIAELRALLESERQKLGHSEEQIIEISELRTLLENERQKREQLEQELMVAKSQVSKRSVNGSLTRQQGDELLTVRHRLDEELKERERLEEEIRHLKEQVSILSEEHDEHSRRIMMNGGSGRSSLGSESPLISLSKPNHMRDTINGQRATIAKLFEQVGLHKILSLLESEDVDVRVHAVKVVANLAAEEANQEKIVEAGGLGSLLMLLQSSEDETIRRVAAGAVANLAMNETNQELIMSQGGIGLLARTADDAEDPQTLRMVAGAIANLCGNDKLQVKLREEGGIRALLGMVRSRHPDVLAQVARGIANFAKCESRGAAQGYKMGRSLLIDDGALPWIVANANNEASPIRRHIELALCHLAQHEVNAKDLVAGGALWELVRISRECSREDIRNLAQRTLNASGTFQVELRRLHLVY